MKRHSIFTALLLSISPLAASAAQALSWADGTVQDESSGNWQASNSGSTAIGGGQMTEAAIVSAGFATYGGPITSADYNGSDGNLVWTGKDGVNSTSQFLNNIPAQQDAMNTYAGQIWQSDQNNGAASYVGQTVAGQQLNQSAILSGSWYLGSPGMASYLQNGGQVWSNSAGNPCAKGSPGCSYNALETGVAQARIARGSQYDSSSITGANATVGESAAGTDTETVNGQTEYCSPQVAQYLQAASQAYIAQQNNLVNTPGVGYTTMNGNTLAQAAGLQPTTNGAGAGDMSDYSCLNNLLGGLNISLSPPNLSQILNGILNQACNKAQSMLQNQLQPLTNDLDNTQNIGGFFPGLDVPVNAGASVSYGSGQSGVTLNNALGGSTNWFSGVEQNATSGANGYVNQGASYFGNILSSEVQ